MRIDKHQVTKGNLFPPYVWFVIVDANIYIYILSLGLGGNRSSYLYHVPPPLAFRTELRWGDDANIYLGLNFFLKKRV